MILNQAVCDDLWEGEKSIGFFVCCGSCFWVVDEKYNFCLDAEKDYRAYLESGDITQEQYELACKNFRGGVLRLTAENFPQYLKASEGKVLSPLELDALFEPDGKLFERIEQHYLSGEALSVDEFKLANIFVSRLPKFYVNFDRKIYMHMDYGRCHEESAYPGWIAQCVDFNFLIPDRERYWVKEGSDYWKLRFL
ncbi:hypothetical protein [Pseudomonas paraglycinae]|uniref:hypothetical protein n=1 Tax=Pseudomonas paraglycinae TaxID=2892330 RepID=UPI001F22EE67|nr:hypothetical protein [Pseudomonas paraglycinae]